MRFKELFEKLPDVPELNEILAIQFLREPEPKTISPVDLAAWRYTQNQLNLISLKLKLANQITKEQFTLYRTIIGISSQIAEDRSAYGPKVY